MTQANGHQTAFCTDYAVELSLVLSRLNAAPNREVGVCLNPNSYDCHTLLEVFHSDQ